MDALLRRLLLAWLASGAIPSAFAQSPNTSTIIVRVVDQSGAVVPGADIVVTNDQTSASRRVVSGLSPDQAEGLTPTREPPAQLARYVFLPTMRTSSDGTRSGTVQP